MKARKVIKKTDGSAEEKIKEAARKLFTQKGFAAVKTRDIAAEAGLNLALLNYYFRSKQKLFDLIMMENLQQFAQGIAIIFINEETSLEKKIEILVEKYIDMLIQFPDLPLFVLSELRSNPEKFAAKMSAETKAGRSHFANQIREAVVTGKIAPVHPLHFIANLIGLIVFPFVGRPILQRIGDVTSEQFKDLMEERKKLIPQWVKAMMMAK